MFLPAEIPPSLISPQKASAGYGENSVDSVQLTTSATADQSVKLSGVNSSPSEAQRREQLAEFAVLCLGRGLRQEYHHLSDHRQQRHRHEEIKLIVADIVESVVKMDKWKLTVRIYADKERENREHQEKKDARHHV